MNRTRIVLCVALVASSLALPATAVAAPDTPTDFASSFEPGDPQPAENTVETDPSGARKAGNITGASFIPVPGSITARVTEVTASGENRDGGEIAANLVDSDVLTKWLTFTSTAFVQFKLAEPLVVRRYALSSANDAPGRDPQDWTLQGSSDGTTWTDLDTRTGQTFTERYQTKTYEFANSTAFGFYRLNITRNAGDPLIQLAELQISD